jgi:hypothetical protein
MCSGPSHAAVNAATEAPVGEVEVPDCLFPVVATMSSAVRSPASRSRTARVTSAPAPARARAVSTPMPDAPAGDDNAAAGEVDFRQDLGGRGVEPEACRDACRHDLPVPTVPCGKPVDMMNRRNLRYAFQIKRRLR